MIALAASGTGNIEFLKGAGLTYTLTSGKGTPVVPSAPLNLVGIKSFLVFYLNTYLQYFQLPHKTLKYFCCGKM